MTGIKIKGVTIRDYRPKADGARIIAHFDCEIFDGALGIKGCSLVRTAKDGITVWPPRAADNQVRSSVHFQDSAFIHAMMSAARDAYRALGGTEAEWAPRSHDGVAT